MRRPAIGLVVLGAVSAAAATGARGVAADIRVANSVVLTRADGSVVPLAHRIRVSCGRWERDVPVPAISVVVGDPRGRAVWVLRAVVADVRRRPVVRFPHTFVYNRPSGAQISGGDAGNEFSTAEEESSGRVVLRTVRCGRRPAIRFRVDGVLGSELFDGAPMTMRGTFTARSS